MKAYPKRTRFLVWGFGVTGRHLSEALQLRGYETSVVEDRPESDFSAYAENISTLRARGVKFHFGGDLKLEEFLRKRPVDVFSPSPGIAVPETIRAVCRENRIQIVGELEIAYRLVPGRIIAVTGTDGKTTTVTIIEHILKRAGMETHLGGNIGLPFIALAGKTKPEHWVVLEVSSYQLETTRLFRPEIAIVTNIAEDHIGRHGDLRGYIRAKARIFEHQKEEDHAIVNFDDPCSLQAFEHGCARLHGFSLAGPISGGAWRQENSLVLDRNGESIPVVATDELQVVGEHNHYNMLAAILACHLAGCPVDAISEGCRTYKGLPHRIEPISEIQGVLWVNDSKATNVHSTISALKAFDRPVVLLLGGFDKGLDLTDLVPHIQRRAKHVILMGDTRNRFRRILREAGYNNITVRKTLAEACAAADAIAERGDVVLLSPASSSFDQFKDYVDRGETFRRGVERKALKKERQGGQEAA